MARWEVCRIDIKWRVEKGFLTQREFWKWVAVTDTLSGEQIIEQTPEWEKIPDSSDKRYAVEKEKREHLRSVLVGMLLSGGWEPIGAENTQVTVFRRQVP
jgi:hypothetical protein